MTEMLDILHNDPLLVKLKNEGLSLGTPMLQEEGLVFIAGKAKTDKALRILEIGTAIGYSAISLHVLTGSEVWSIERDRSAYDIATKNVENARLTQNIHLIFGDALTIDISDLATFDIIFIDAAKAQYQKFFERFAPHLSHNGVIITDNLSFHGIVDSPLDHWTHNQMSIAKKIKGFVTWLQNNQEFQTEFHAVGDGMSVSRRR